MARTQKTANKTVKKLMTKKKKPKQVKDPAAKKPAKPKAVKVSQAEIDNLAQRTVNLWREQMLTLVQTPKNIAEMGKGLEPTLNLFTQSLDMWLNMFDLKTGFGADKMKTGMPWNGFFTGSDDDQGAASTKPSGNAKKETTRKTASAEKPAKRKPASKRKKIGAKTASALSGNRDASVAELAGRLANFKGQRKGMGRPAASEGMAGSATNVTELAAARQKRRRKA